jgi:hypothetical protein
VFAPAVFDCIVLPVHCLFYHLHLQLLADFVEGPVDLTPPPCILSDAIVLPVRCFHTTLVSHFHPAAAGRLCGGSSGLNVPCARYVCPCCV